MANPSKLKTLIQEIQTTENQHILKKRETEGCPQVQQHLGKGRPRGKIALDSPSTANKEYDTPLQYPPKYSFMNKKYEHPKEKEIERKDSWANHTQNMGKPLDKLQKENLV